MKVVAKSSVDKIRSLDEVGFGGFGHIKVRTIGPEFMAWILSTYDEETKTFIIGDDISFELTEEDIQKVYGLLRGSKDVDIDKCSSVLMVEEARYLGLHDGKGTKETVDLKILKERLTNETDIGKWRILLILYVIGSVLCPVSHQTTSLKYMKLLNLTNIKDIKSYNWCKHVLVHFRKELKSGKTLKYFNVDTHALLVSLSKLIFIIFSYLIYENFLVCL
ncbi:hypothetical protein LINPERPRIM_LOCUS24046 [Linum perenne]